MEALSVFFSSVACTSGTTMQVLGFLVLGGRRIRQIQRAMQNAKVTLLCLFVTVLVLRGTIGAKKFGTPEKDFNEIREHLIVGRRGESSISIRGKKMAYSQGLITIIMYLGALLALSEATGLQPQVGKLQESALRSREVETVGVTCSYVVQIKTSCLPFAGTDDRISITFGDAFGNQVYVARLDDPTIDTFERCSTDSFTILGPCVYSVCYLYLMRVGSDQWKPEWVRVYYGRSQPVSFYYDGIIPASLWYGFYFCSTVTATQSALSIM